MPLGNAPLVPPPQARTEIPAPEEDIQGVVSESNFAVISVWQSQGKECVGVKVGVTPLPSESLIEAGRRAIQSCVLLKRETETAIEQVIQER